ncbi:MAG: hypothetical protein F2842_07650 [Actinobacteria bacterium]|nr:hypothetical protein [Actinomycetota bacterium]
MHDLQPVAVDPSKVVPLVRVAKRSYGGGEALAPPFGGLAQAVGPGVLGAQHAGTQVASMLGVVGEPLEEGALGPLPRLALGRRGWVF